MLSVRYRMTIFGGLKQHDTFFSNVFSLSLEAYGRVVLERQRLGHTCIKAEPAIAFSQYSEDSCRP